MAQALWSRTNLLELDVDVVRYAIGATTRNRSWRVLKKGGVLVPIVAPPSEDEATKHGVRSALISAQVDTSVLCEIARLIDPG